MSGQVAGDLAEALIALEPARAFLVLDGQMRAAVAEGLGVAGPQPGIEHAERDALRRDQEGRVQVQAALGGVGKRAEPLDVVLAGEVELGGVLDGEHDALGAGALEGALGVGREHALGAHLLVAEETVGRLRLGPATGRGRDAQRRLRPEGVQ